MPAKKGLNYFWEPLGSFADPVAGSQLLTSRGWQIKAIEDGVKQPYQILNAPTGSGKSFVTQNIIAQKLHRDPRRKAIIAFPMSQIAQNFAHEQFQMPDGSTVWSPINICGEITNYGKTKRLIQWLKEDGGTSINNRVAICTYSTLLRVPRALLRKLQPIIWLDEAHHANCEFGKFNKLGELLAELMEAGCQIGLSTATLFRGDRCTIIPAAQRPLFFSTNVSYEEHLRSMRHIRGLTYDFHTYVETPEVILQKMLAEDKSTIVYLPHVNTYSWRIPKKDQINALMGMLAQGNAIHETVDGVFVAAGKKVVDLVTPHKIAEKQRYIGNGKINPVDYVLALGRCKEGTNIPQATRIIIIGARQSLREVVQIVGRLLRDHPDKSTVEVHHLIRWDPEASHVRGAFSNYLASIYFCFLLGEVIAPKMESLQYLPADQALKTLDTVVRTVLERKINKQYKDADLEDIAKALAPADLDRNKFAAELAALLERQDSFIIKELLSADSNQFCGRVLTADLLKDMRKDQQEAQIPEAVKQLELDSLPELTPQPVLVDLKPTKRAEALLKKATLQQLYNFYQKEATPGERQQLETALDIPKWPDEWEGKSVFLQPGLKGNRKANEAAFLNDSLPANYYVTDKKRAMWWKLRQAEIAKLTKERDDARTAPQFYYCWYPLASEQGRERPITADAACKLLGSAAQQFHQTNPQNPLWILQTPSGGKQSKLMMPDGVDLWQKWALIRGHYSFGYEPWSHCNLSKQHSLPWLLKTAELKAALNEYADLIHFAQLEPHSPFSASCLANMNRLQFECWSKVSHVQYPYIGGSKLPNLENREYVDLLRSALRHWWGIVGHGLPVTWLDHLAKTRKDVNPVTMGEVRAEWAVLCRDQCLDGQQKTAYPISSMLMMEALVWCDNTPKPGSEDWNSTLFLEHELLIREQLRCVPDRRGGHDVLGQLAQIKHLPSYQQAKAQAFDLIASWPNGMRRCFRNTLQKRWA